MKITVPHQSLDSLDQETLSFNKEKGNIQPFILSVAIPTRNRRTLLQELIESILSQLSCSIQIVISDNASDDDTNSYCGSLLSGHSLITCLHLLLTVLSKHCLPIDSGSKKWICHVGCNTWYWRPELKGLACN